MNSEPITNKQKTIISLLLKFRYITVAQLLKYFNLKDPKRTRERLKDLLNKKYIDRIKDPKDVTKPIVYCLAQKARRILNGVAKNVLDELYKEKGRSIFFKNHCLFIVDIYLFFLTNKEKTSKLTFCTQRDLKEFDYLPKDLDAYLAVENKKGTKRYFLELFDDYHNKQSVGSIRFAVRKYIKYCKEGSWQANTANSPFPSVLFVLPIERRRQFTHHYARAKLAKTFEDISLFLTTQDTIRFGKGKENIWEKVD